MLSSDSLARMDNLNSASSGSSMSPTATDKETKLNPKSRVSIFATLRRKTSRIFVTKNTPSQTPVPFTDYQPQQRRRWFNSVGGRHSQRQNIRDHFEGDERTETPTTPTTPTPYSNRDGPTPPHSPARRLLRTTSSMFLSLRGRFQQESPGSPESHYQQRASNDDDNGSDHVTGVRDPVVPKAPVLALPADVKARAGWLGRRSSFQLGVQKAVQDTVDKNFSLDSACDTPVSLGPRSRPTLPPLATIASMNSSLEEASRLYDTRIGLLTSARDGCLTSPSMSTCANPSGTPREFSSDSPTLPSSSQQDSARTSMDTTVNGNSNSLSSPKTFSSNVSIPSRQRRILSDSSWSPESPEAPVCTACGSANQSRLMERSLCELNQLSDEELEALFRNKLGGLSLVSLASSRGHCGPYGSGSKVGADEAAELELNRAEEQDDKNTTASILEGDSNMCASTPRRSLREELLQVGEASQISWSTSQQLEGEMEQ